MNFPIALKISSTILLLILTVVVSHTVHKHAHNHVAPGTGERMEDGSYKPRDIDHHGADGEHFAEFDHEAILGSVKEAEEYHQLSAEESKQRLRILVETRIDTNKDQFVDKHELKAHILRSFK